jgi:hypothetical protein
MNWNEHVQNRNRFPREELLKLEGQHVAWSLDGARILAADVDPSNLIKRLDAAGHRSEEYVLSFVDFELSLGGAILNEAMWEESE